MSRRKKETSKKCFYYETGEVKKFKNRSDIYWPENFHEKVDKILSKDVHDFYHKHNSHIVQFAKKTTGKDVRIERGIDHTVVWFQIEGFKQIFVNVSRLKNGLKIYAYFYFDIGKKEDIFEKEFITDKFSGFAGNGLGVIAEEVFEEIFLANCFDDFREKYLKEKQEEIDFFNTCTLTSCF